MNNKEMLLKMFAILMFAFITLYIILFTFTVLQAIQSQPEKDFCKQNGFDGYMIRNGKNCFYKTSQTIILTPIHCEETGTPFIDYTKKCYIVSEGME